MVEYNHLISQGEHQAHVKKPNNFEQKKNAAHYTAKNLGRGGDQSWLCVVNDPHGQTTWADCHGTSH